MSKKYESLFGSDKPLTAPQFLAELICKKSSELQNIQLPPLFWRDKKNWADWARRFHTEIIAANKLLKVYKPEAIIAALKTKKASRVQSLHNKSLPEIIYAEQRRLEALEANRTQLEVNTNTMSVPKKRKGKKGSSLINKLRD